MNTYTEDHIMDITLWGVAIIAGIGDIITTIYGLSIGMAEANPVILFFASNIGILASLVILKIIVIIIGLLLEYYIDDYKWMPPIVITLVWGIAMSINLTLILL